MIQQNPAAERAVVAGIIRYSGEAYFDICDIVRETSFTIDSNAVIFKCCKHILETDNNSIVDIPSIYAAANTLGLGFIFEKKQEVQHLQSVSSFPIDIRNVRKHAAQISKLEVARLLDSQLTSAKEELGQITGEEALSQILGIAENSIFNFSSLLNDEQSYTKLGNNIQERFEYLANNPVDQVGVPTGYSNFDKVIGGGLRPGSLNVIAARPKKGKSTLARNIGFYISEKDCPVFDMDTEMSLEEHQDRVASLITRVSIDDIETGKFGIDPVKKDKVFSALKRIQNSKFDFRSISGMPFEEQMALMRRWLVKEVGLKPTGKANKCVIIYDYLKLMDDAMLKNMQEFQALGMMMTSLHNFARRYEVPILAFVQLNRDGIQKESADTIAQSDRITWFCTSLSIWKEKSPDEIASDGPESGNRKLVTILSRHGTGSDTNEYIDFKMDGWCSLIKEGKFSSELQHTHNQTDPGFEVKDDNDDEIPFTA
jgi:replicative DNA helicase